MLKFLPLICGFILLANGCSKKAKPVDPNQRQRMAEIREQIKNQLGEKYDKPVPAATADQLKRGSQLYPQICASCHGGRGEGKGHIADGILGTPSNFTDAEEATFYSEQARLHIIRKGIPGTAMMGWENVLIEKDILAVYLYIRSLIKSK